MRVCYHGAGFVGFTGGVAAAFRGHEVRLFDVDLDRINKINSKEEPFPGIDEFLYSQGDWRSYHLKLKAQGGCWEKADIHVIAVPTVRGHRPSMELIEGVVMQLLHSRHADLPSPAILIESTIDPAFAEKLARMAEDGLPVAVATRRDWFVNPLQHVRNTERVVGMDTGGRRASVFLQFLTSVTDEAMIYKTDIETAAMVKALENALLDVPSVLAQELSVQYPDVDVREAFRLAGTHWRIPTYFPNLAVGGYCVPLGTQYLMRSTYGESWPPVAHGEASILWSAAYDGDVALRAIYTGASGHPDARTGPEVRTIVYGVSYRNEVKVHQNGVADRMRRMGWKGFTVADGQYTHDELRGLGFTPEENWLEPQCRIALVTVWYPEWSAVDWSGCETVIDGTGKLQGDNVWVIGRPGWLPRAGSSGSE